MSSVGGWEERSTADIGFGAVDGAVSVQSAAQWPPSPPVPPRRSLSPWGISAPFLISMFAGLGLGLAWILLVPKIRIDAQYYFEDYSLWITSQSPELMAARDSIFGVGALVIGIIVGLWLGSRSGRAHSGARTILWLLAGVVGSVVAYVLGVVVRPWDVTMVDGVSAGIFPLGLRAYGALFVWPLTAAVVTTLMTLLSMAFGAPAEDRSK